MSSEQARFRWKTGIVTSVVVGSNVLGNFFLTWGVRLAGELRVPADYLRALLIPWVVVGVALLLVWTLSHMALLSWADLSFVLPVTSVGYVLTALAGRLFLSEQVSVARWAGIALITGGVILVGRTPPSTTTSSASRPESGA
jgi:uncharacterized membrane protein